MSEILVEDGTTYPVSVTVPEDGDARNAASVVVGFQALANRLAHIWTKFANALIGGGTITQAQNVTWAFSPDRGWTFTGDNTNNIVITGGPILNLNQNVKGALFLPGATGRANKKLVNLSTSANQLISPLEYDTYAYLTGAAIEVQVSVAEGTLKDGEWFRVINKPTSVGTITVKNTAGATLHVVPLPSGAMPAMREYTWHAATTSWVLTDWAVA
jgi:hypothetical protein